MKWAIQSAAVAIAAVLAIAALFYPQTGTTAVTKNGFDISQATIPVDEILSGGPPRDGIPALHSPKFESSANAKQLQPNDIVLGLVGESEQKAYPVAILNWHEIVNDTFDGKPVAVTYCPLCGSGMAFETGIDASGEPRRFGVSGLLYNSDMLMYDMATESLWAQLKGRAVSGPSRNKTLTQVPMRLMRWKQWVAQYPQSVVLSRDTGFNRDYDRDPYQGYSQTERLYFPVANALPESSLAAKAWVVGYQVDDHRLAIPIDDFENLASGKYQYQWQGHTLVIDWQQPDRQLTLFNAQQQLLVTTQLFWFAWYTFNPNTAILDVDTLMRIEK